jgi:hypothetical protein
VTCEEGYEEEEEEKEQNKETYNTSRFSLLLLLLLVALDSPHVYISFHHPTIHIYPSYSYLFLFHSIP